MRLSLQPKKAPLVLCPGAWHSGLVLFSFVTKYSSHTINHLYHNLSRNKKKSKQSKKKINKSIGLCNYHTALFVSFFFIFSLEPEALIIPPLSFTNTFFCVCFTVNIILIDNLMADLHSIIPIKYSFHSSFTRS